MDQVQRHDVAQADIATLMAYLVGLEFPVNSVGELPLSFLDADDQQKAKALLVNARGVLEMYRVKEEKKAAQVLRYQPYSGFADAEHSTEHRLDLVEQLIQNGQYQESIKSSGELIALGLAGLRYLQTYDWLFLRALITVGYLGWIAYALTTVVDLYVLHGNTKPARSIPGILFFSSVLSSTLLSRSVAASLIYAAMTRPMFFILLLAESRFSRSRRASMVRNMRPMSRFVA